jgi:hypothetical protein
MTDVSEEDASLFMFYPSSLIRHWSILISQSTIFETIIIIMIILSSLKLVMDTYIDSTSPLAGYSSQADIIFNFIFMF